MTYLQPGILGSSKVSKVIDGKKRVSSSVLQRIHETERQHEEYDFSIIPLLGNIVCFDMISREMSGIKIIFWMAYF